MGSVQSLNPRLDLEHFFEYMYGDLQGYAYSPTKDPLSDNFQQYFFHWPTEKEALVTHAIHSSTTLEVYYSPFLFNSPSAKKESFLGTRFVWVEFDGTLPASDLEYPQPSIKIQSSEEGNQHWYWELDTIVNDVDALESITRRLAYYLKADLGCWNANRVLRPPGTRHHESGREVLTLRMDTRAASILDFAKLPEVSTKFVRDEDFKSIPPALDVIAMYSWKDRMEDFEFFKLRELPTKEGKSKGSGYRSSALTKLCFICIEMGMSDPETLSMLINADERWKKFTKRQDQKRWLTDIINHCRAEKGIPEGSTEGPGPAQKRTTLQIFTYGEFMEIDYKPEWLVPDLIHKAGLYCISGQPGIGKSQLALRLGEKMAKGDRFLNWDTVNPHKFMFVSMEMSHPELWQFLKTMNMKFTPETKENLLMVPVGQSLRISTAKAQATINEAIEKHRPDSVLFDSFGVAISDDINSEKIIFEAMDYINGTIRNEYNIAAGFIHHPRKSQVGNRKPTKLDDLYGNQYFSAALTTCLGLWKTHYEIEVSCLKMRLAEEFQPFRIKRTPDLDFITSDVANVAEVAGSPLFGGGLGDTI